MESYETIKYRIKGTTSLKKQLDKDISKLKKELEKALPAKKLDDLIKRQRAKGIEIDIFEGIRSKSRKGKKMNWLRAEVIIDSEVIIGVWWRPDRHTWEFYNSQRDSWRDFESVAEARQKHWDEINLQKEA